MKPFVQNATGAVVVLGFMGTLLFVLAHYNVELKEVALVLVGVLAGKFGTVVDYQYGSSAGSARKDEIQLQKGEK
jgi:hypothetical protein